MDSLSLLQTALADRYRIERPLGEGGMATVYLARDLKHERNVALKVLKPELAQALGAQRFLKEIHVTANLQHPHILPLYDSGQVGDVLFYVMPLITGESLRQRIVRDGALPVTDAVRIAQQVAGALDFAHRQGVLHRDIKPENILLQDGEALLADFGIALAANGGADARMTGTGMSVGTVEYMSPEQAAGERSLDVRSDVYSLGAVTYEMLVGTSPAHAATAQAMLAKLMTETPTAAHTARADVPVAMSDAVQRSLEKQPANRFASAREFADALIGGAAISPPRTSGPTTVARAPFPRTLVALIVVAAISLGTWFAIRPQRAGGTSFTPIHSIAVLPLALRSADTSQAYFAEGMTDELTSAVATISALRVTSRGSAMQFQGSARPATAEIAKALNVDAIVEGSVAREGGEVRITANLIDARVDSTIWTKTFTRSSNDVLALQTAIASEIAGQIKVQLTSHERARLASARSVNPEAHDAYLLGRYFFNRPSDDNLHKAIVQFEQSVALDSTFAAGWSGLSDAYLWAGYNEGFLTATEGKIKSKQAALRAVQLDSLSAEAHASLATFLLFYDKDWQACEREYRAAIALNPNYAFAHDQFGMALAFVGRLDEAIAEGKRAAELDPLSPQILIDASITHLYRKDTTAAIALAKRAGRLDSTYFFPYMIEGWAHLETGQYERAIPLLQKANSMSAPPFVTAYLAFAQGMAGHRDTALRQITVLEKMSPGGKVLPFNLALVYLGVGDKAKAIAYFEQAYDADSQLLAWLGQDAMFDALRNEPRFTALLRKLHFVK